MHAAAKQDKRHDAMSCGMLFFLHSNLHTDLKCCHTKFDMNKLSSLGKIHILMDADFFFRRIHNLNSNLMGKNPQKLIPKCNIARLHLINFPFDANSLWNQNVWRNFNTSQEVSVMFKVFFFGARFVNFGDHKPHTQTMSCSNRISFPIHKLPKSIIEI